MVAVSVPLPDISSVARPDLRMVLGVPITGEYILVRCPRHNDPTYSMAVYEDHTFCFGGCGWLRRYESLALLVGLWDGKEATVRQAVRAVKAGKWLTDKAYQATARVEISRPSSGRGIDTSMPATFHRYLLSKEDTLSYFIKWRGLSIDTIRHAMVGYTGTHFTLPIWDSSGTLVSIRYRSDPRWYADNDTAKYSGIRNHNGVYIYDARDICKYATNDMDLWVTEGEYDRLALFQMGSTRAVTLTNGAATLDKLPDILSAMGLYPYRWVLALDQDDAGNKAGSKLYDKVKDKVLRAEWPTQYKDVSALLSAGGSLRDISVRPYV